MATTYFIHATLCHMKQKKKSYVMHSFWYYSLQDVDDQLMNRPTSFQLVLNLVLSFFKYDLIFIAFILIFRSSVFICNRIFVIKIKF